MPEAILQVRLANHPSELARMARLVEGFAEAHTLSNKTKYNLSLILEEWLTNVMSYGFDIHDESSIDVYINLHNDQLSAVVVDDGKAFNPLEHPVPDVKIPLEERRVGGLGIHLVRNLADTISYERAGDKNKLTLNIKVKDC